MQTDIASLRNIYSDLSRIAFQAAASIKEPSLSSYSPVPSMQQIANQHSSAIGASTGCAILVANAILREIEWASNNIKSFADSLEHQEKSLASVFSEAGSTRTLNPAVNIQFTHNFAARPEFQVGKLSFFPATLTSELALSAENLLAAFEATQDIIITDAQRFWESLKEKMVLDSESIRAAAERLHFDHEGDAFSAAATHLAGLSSRISLVADSSDVMASSLKPLPKIKATATSRIKEILEQSSTIENSTERKMIEQSEIQHFLRTHYLPQLQTTIPIIPSLTTPHYAGIFPSTASAATPRNASLELDEDRRTQTMASTYAASRPSFSSGATSPVATSLTVPTLSSSIKGNAANHLLTPTQGSTPSTAMGHLDLNTTHQRRPGIEQTSSNSLRGGSLPLVKPGAADRRVAGASALHPDRLVSTAMSRNVGRSMMSFPAPARLVESPSATSRLLGTPQSSGVAIGQPIHENSASNKNRPPTGGSLRGGTSIAPVSSMGGSAKKSASPIEQVSRVRRSGSKSANYTRLFGSTGPTVPGILGADLRD